jgi:hypothetical protein
MHLAEPLREATGPDLTNGSARSLAEAVAEAYGELNPEVLVAGIFVHRIEVCGTTIS